MALKIVFYFEKAIDHEMPKFWFIDSDSVCTYFDEFKLINYITVRPWLNENENLFFTLGLAKKLQLLKRVNSVARYWY